MRYHTGWSSRQNKAGDLTTEIVVSRRRWRWDAIERLTDGLCAITLHRLCNATLMMWIYKTTDGHTEKFRIPASPDLVAEFNDWREWSPVHWRDE